VPGDLLEGSPESFATAGALVSGFERLAAGLPVLEGVEVLRAAPIGGAWRLETSRGYLIAGSVVMASGFQNVPRKPAYADALPPSVEQLHAGEYRRPGELPEGVLVVGGGQSGVQIAEDLLDDGHRVYLSTSRVARLPRSHRGRDAFEWMRDAGQLDLPTESADLAAIAATPPQVSGAAGGRTVSYQALAKRGATLLGHAAGWNGRELELAPDLGENIRFADEASRAFREAWDRHAQLRRPLEPDPGDEPAEELYGLSGPRSLDLGTARVSAVIWATGFGPSTGWLPRGALDEYLRPRLPGLYVVGASWLTHRSSANLYGMAADAKRLANGFAGVAAA
jgi:putative flavoprotein involved in K+ transport